MSYAEEPCAPELAAVLAAGLLHVVTEIALSPAAAITYNVAVSTAFVAYLLWRARRSPGATRVWGMRLDNLRPALLVHGTLGLLGAAAILAYGVAVGKLHLPRTFWMTVGLYPAWGIAQQFALQSLVARNLTGLVSGAVPLALTAAALFALAHAPRWELVTLSFVAGLLLTLVYRRHPNLWAVGIVHGILGSLAFYVLLEQDPGGALLEFLGGL